MATAASAPCNPVVAKASAPAAAPTRNPTAIASTVTRRSRACSKIVHRGVAVPAVVKAPPRHDQFGRCDAKLRHIAGHHIGLRNVLHQKPDHDALRAHRHGGKHASDDAVPIARVAHRWAEHHDANKNRQQKRFKAEHPRQHAALRVVRRDAECGGHGRGRDKRGDRNELAGNAEIARYEFRAGDNETAGDLRGEQAEQAQIGVAVEITGDEAEQHRHQQRHRRVVAARNCFGHGNGSALILLSP